MVFYLNLSVIPVFASSRVHIGFSCPIEKFSRSMAYETSKENEAFVFTWSLENYSLCQQTRGVSLTSPSFTMGILEKTKWHLSLYPKGKSDDFLTCDLYRENDSGSGSLTINSQFSFLLAEGISKHEFKVESNSYSKQHSSSHKLMKISTLLAKKHVLLPRDILTIQCRMWKNNTDIPEVTPTPAIKALVACLYNEKDENSCKLPDAMYKTAEIEVMDLKKKLYPYLNKCLVRTRLGIERLSFVWPIKNISSLKQNQKFSVPLISASKRTPPLILIISLINTNDIQITIHKKSETDIGAIFVICRLAVLDINEREHLVSENEHHFVSPTADEVWAFPSFFTKSKMIEQKLLCLPNDILSLSCSLTISTGVEASVIEGCNFVSFAHEKLSKNSESGTLTEDMKTLYIDKKLFDVNLKVGDKYLPAHKAVLGSRSPVFRAMFEHDTAEKMKSAVDILDVDFNTLDRMLYFIYSDDIETLNSDTAIKLYTAADKYQIDCLREKCSTFLMSHVTSKNVYELLVLANMHQDKGLKKAAEEFLFKPPYEKLFSVEFEAFINNNTHLARETLCNWIKEIKSQISLNF